MRFDLPEAYIRAVRMRAAEDGIYPRDVLIAALDRHLAANTPATDRDANSREADRDLGRRIR